MAAPDNVNPRTGVKRDERLQALMPYIADLLDEWLCKATNRVHYPPPERQEAQAVLEHIGLKVVDGWLAVR